VQRRAGRDEEAFEIVGRLLFDAVALARRLDVDPTSFYPRLALERLAGIERGCRR